MTLDEIKAAVESGETVHWSNSSYTVRKDSAGQWLVVCARNGHCAGLTWRDGRTMDYKPADFYLAAHRPSWL